MPDITKCTNESCQLKESCFRWTAKPNDYMQSYAEFHFTLKTTLSKDGIHNKSNVECDHFLGDKSLTNKAKQHGPQTS